jgi:hypothetical protein
MSQKEVIYQIATEVAKEQDVKLDSGVLKNKTFKEEVAKRLLVEFQSGRLQTKKSDSEEALVKYCTQVVSNSLTKDKRVNPSELRLRLKIIK